VARMQRYAAGQSVTFGQVHLGLDHLTEFQRRIIAECRAIRYGQTRSYGELAQLAGFPRAARAVGSTMAGNRFPILVPCHRVINGDGSLGQYGSAGGVRTKRRMLALEGVHPKAAGRASGVPPIRKRPAIREVLAISRETGRGRGTLFEAQN
jgi:methylated-DNA-[protein]-cysteine S-methyltransferase